MVVLGRGEGVVVAGGGDGGALGANRSRWVVGTLWREGGLGRRCRRVVGTLHARFESGRGRCGVVPGNVGVRKTFHARLESRKVGDGVGGHVRVQRNPQCSFGEQEAAMVRRMGVLVVETEPLALF
jgi:hypothetical protein